MGESIKLEVQLRAFVRKDGRTRWIAVCPSIDVVTQGTSSEDAKRQLDDAVHGWFEDCLERGTLDQALRECGFHTCTSEEAGRADQRVILSREEEPDVRGDQFAVHVTIPAYQAAALMTAP